MLSCAHWSSWRIGLSPGAAREQVRVARRLVELPGIAAAFGAGRMSHPQARAITRVARVDDGVDWVELARHTSAAQIGKIVRGIRRVETNEQAAADPAAAGWKVRTRERYDRDGNLVITIVTRPEHGPALQAGLAAQRAQLDRERQLDGDAWLWTTCFRGNAAGRPGQRRGGVAGVGAAGAERRAAGSPGRGGVRS